MVFVDAGAFAVRSARRDPYNQAASRIWAALEGSMLVTTNHVVEETLTLLARRIGYGLGGDMAERIHASANLTIIYTEADDEQDATPYFRKFAGQRVSFTDCISFGVMRRNGLNVAFTFDRPCAMAGFRMLGVQ